MLSAAELSIGRRLAGATRTDVRRALWQERTLVKTFGPRGTIHLLPYFDAYVVAGQPRERLYPGAAAARALTPAGQAGNYPVLLVDGVVGGVWHQRRSGSKLAIVEPLRGLTAPQRRQLDDEAALVGAVMEATATLTVGTVTAGPHA
ncbi:MAG: winged helix DNA-binding domain-containing protein [Actinobacteria bacterium]|nr:winged helix DNA-binding domain-containing protein [Actinomycetota bacterium]